MQSELPVCVTVRVFTVDYRGRLKHKVASENTIATLTPNTCLLSPQFSLSELIHIRVTAARPLPVVVSAREYASKLTDDHSFLVTAFARVLSDDEAKSTPVAAVDFRRLTLRAPVIDVQVACVDP